MFGKSWIELAVLIAKVVLQILAQEEAHGVGEGAAKKALVLEAARTHLATSGLEAPQQECTIDEIMGYVGDVIDNIVRLGNCLGIFTAGG